MDSGATGGAAGRFDQTDKGDELDDRTKKRWHYSSRADHEGDRASFQSHLLPLEFHSAVGLHHERAIGLGL
jgi:hypothetical protein